MTTSTRIDARFAELQKQGRSAFVTFLMAGDPDPATSLDIIKSLPKAGADIIEIGMPFTDPMADGPSIQAAGLRALKAGMTLRKTLEMVRGFRKDDDTTPLVLMGYYNPIYIYGVDKFLVDALAASLDAAGHATTKTVGAVADLVAALAQGVRGAKQAAE